ncbi:MAG TPA: aminomethyl-transferring glycine dehydrogenase subunit GcvPB [Oligoflexia bacterium]|nr:aminomethyl-transferring glycine dehydrogenase subunit GcvPB [Oligoflexia bacterium]HMR23750.1 aminomethyl-transferring glycine dehydrogenase subunit GcvPB [Oligoflexia bacterium]
MSQKKQSDAYKVQTEQRSYKYIPSLLEKSIFHDTSLENNKIKSKNITSVPKEYIRSSIEDFPNVSEFEVVRHYTNLSRLNFSIDEGFYPLGSCTMKYNPKINDWAANLPGFRDIHPYASEKTVQGALELMYLLQESLTHISGLKACSLHPAAGAQGELAGVKMIAKYHQENNQSHKNTVLVPDSAHGTNPASAALCGLKVREIKTGSKGYIEYAQVEAAMGDDVAAIMTTVPNTLGIFEKDIVKISQLMHDNGALVYGDGANLNALVGKASFGAMGVDVMHINLHKTFSTPHGGGGPGAGPVVVSDRLKNFLPSPIVNKDPKTGEYCLDYSIPHSVGQYRAFYGNFGMLVRALCYIYAFGHEYLAKISEYSVLNANYIRKALEAYFHLPYETDSLHEVVFSDQKQRKNNDVNTMDIAKRLMDYGYHPPTVYFPLIVDGALMMEPTESESKRTLDRYIETMIKIAKECKDNPEVVKSAPHKTGIKRLNETQAARNPVLTWSKLNK